MAKVLIVDDSAFTRHLLGVIVKMGGHEVIGTAEDGKQGLQMFKTLRPDLVTLDWLMPSKSGEAVLKKIIQMDPEAKVIMITGWANSSIEGRVLKAGAKAFMEKSNVQKELLTVIERVVEA
ncbi:MAG: response regulator [Gammaproteobacteria bacterium]|nr:response regulator [Gammaproteobacteria bacterium]MBT8076906.1 response regulator [Gammaproteobacteria bacterium]NNK98690.1 response regulator [Xanthomonadales bacterium]